MPCFDPLDASRRKGSTDKPIIWKRFQLPKNLSPDQEHFQVPCGRCIGCRLEYSRIWGGRCAQEALMHEENAFLTLTYRNEDAANDEQRAKGLFVPRDGSLVKKHHQGFIKRLRYHLGDRRISYYHAGEYGNTCTQHGIEDCPACGSIQRPHYHTLLFGYDFPDKQYLTTVNDHPLYISRKLEELWQYGFAWLGSVTFESAAYVARYALKKITGPLAHEHYLRYDEQGCEYWILPEYSTVSTRPAIGKSYYQEYSADMYPLDRMPIPGRGEFGKPPRYYDGLHEVLQPEEVAAVRESRNKFWAARSDENSPARLRQREVVKQAQIASLTRKV